MNTFFVWLGDTYLVDDPEECGAAAEILRSIVGRNEPARIYQGDPYGARDEAKETDFWLLPDGRQVWDHGSYWSLVS